MTGRDVYHRHVRILAHATAMGTVIFTALAAPAIVEQTPLLDPLCYIPLSAAYCGLPILLSLLAWLGSIRSIRIVARTHTILAVVFGLLWVPSMLDGPTLPDGQTPWILNTFAVIGATAVLAWPSRVVWIYLPAMAIGGGMLLGWHDPLLAILDAISMFSFSAVITAILLLVLNTGRAQDSTLLSSIDQARRTAEIESRARLRSHLGTLVHDDIIATLVFAARPDTARSTSSASARAALDNLARFAEIDFPADEALDASGAEAELRTAIAVVSEGVQVVGSFRECTIPIPRSAAAALEGALLEAVRNSVRHGPPTVAITVRLEAAVNRISALVEDNGPGFLESDIPQHRFGVRLSIIDRMHRVPGGSVMIDSRPGRGTRVRITWDGER